MKIINNDLFNIVNRIKQIDKSYYIVYNKNKIRYEVHSNKQKGSTLAFCLGSKLNAYALKKAMLTSCKFSKKIIKNVINTNLKLEEQNQQNFINRHIETLNNYLAYANKKSSDVNF